MAQPSASTETIPAATVHPAFEGEFMKAFGGHMQHMEQQPVPPVELLTDLVDTPASTTLRLPRQPVPAACYVFMTQPHPVASEPNPVLPPFTNLYGRFVPLLRQPVPAAAHCAPLTSPSEANRLQSMPVKHCSSDYDEASIGNQPHFPMYACAQDYYPVAYGDIHPQSYMVPQSQHLFQPMTSAECGSEHPQTLGGIIEQIEQQINSLRTMRHNPSQVPIQGEEHQQQLSFGLRHATVCDLDNENVIAGVLHLLTAVKLYLQQKKSGSRGSMPEIPLPTSPGSEHYSVFRNGVDDLIEGMQQITGNSLDRDVVCEALMQLGSDDGKSAIEQLFRLLKGEGAAKRVAGCTKAWCH